MSKPVIRTHRLTRRFGKLRAVSDVNIEVRQGEVFGFLGPNGAGKSTLIRMLTGLLPPSSGDVEVLGLTLPRQSEALRPMVGYMTQRFSLYEDLSIYENLDFAAEIFGFKPDRRHKHIEAIMQEHGLDARREQRAGTLSGGWKQRLALAVATIHSPKLLFLDEPTAGVDPGRRRAFWEKLFELAATGTTILVSTHYMDEAVRCHRLAMIREGTLAATGTPAALTDCLRARVVEIEARRPELVIACLRELPEILSATQLGNQVHALLDPQGPPASESAPRLVSRLAEAGLPDCKAKASEPNLEDVFVALSLGEHLDPARDAAA